MRLRRKSETPVEEAVSDADQPEAVGPFDISEIDLDVDGERYVDLGGLLISPLEGMDVRLQVDESSGAVMAVVLANDEGALEVRAFAAQRDVELWSDVRREIGAETARRGGTATEVAGEFGTELHCNVPVTTPEGGAATQPSRVIGHDGHRWFLRATLLGRPVMEPETAAPWEFAIRQIAVRRGAEAMAPGEPLPIELPPNARKVD